MREKSTGTIKGDLANFLKPSSWRTVEALKNINFEVAKGEMFGIIGRNGSGKSTLLKIILGTYPPDKGSEVIVNGSIQRLALGMGFDKNLSARDNIYLNGSLLGLSFKQIGEKFEDIVAFSELEEFIDTKVKFYSNGMKARLTFAIAMYVDTDIILLDEFFGGVGDLRFKEKSESAFQNLISQGKTIINVSHNIPVIRKYSKRVLLLDKGEMVGVGEPEEIIKEYMLLSKKRK